MRTTIKSFALALFFVAALAPAAWAQPYAVDWRKVAGGGGTSSGGGFTLSGTIGQPDAGLLSGGGFTLQGGFWHAADSVAPLRITRIARNPGGTITIEWIGGGTLQVAPILNGSWMDVPGATSPYTFVPPSPALFARVRR